MATSPVTEAGSAADVGSPTTTSYRSEVPPAPVLADDDAATDHPRWERRAAVGAVAVAVAATALAVARSARDWVPTTDWALIEWQVRHVGEQIPLLGAPSAVGFYHPGPLPYLVLAPPYRLFGGDPRALALAAGALSCLTVGAIGATAWRRGGLVTTVAACVVALWLAGSLPAGTLVDPWNPWLAVLPFLWLVVLVWSVLDGDRWMLPVAALAASWVVQAHIGYLVPVAALTLLVVAALAHESWGRRPSSDGRDEAESAHRRRQARRIALATALALGLAWLLPAWQQLTADPGNVALLWDYADGGADVGRAPVGDALGIAATELGWPGPWQTGNEPVDGLSGNAMPSPRWHLLVTLAALAGAAWTARPDRSARLLVVVAAVAVTSTTLAVLFVEQGRFFPYALRLAWPASAAAGLALLASVARRLAPVGSPAVRSVGAVGLVLVVAAAARLVIVSGDAEVPAYRSESRRQELSCLGQLLPAVTEEVGAGPVHVLLAEQWPVMAGPIVNELDRAGIEVAVDERMGFHLQQPGREALPDEVRLVVVEDHLIADWEARDDAVEIARCQELDDRELAELAELQARDDLGTLEQLRLFDLFRRSHEAAVFVVGG